MFIFTFLLELIFIALFEYAVFALFSLYGPINYIGFDGVIEIIGFKVFLSVGLAILYAIYFYKKHSKNQPTLVEKYVYFLLRREMDLTKKRWIPLWLNAFIRCVVIVAFIWGIIVLPLVYYIYVEFGPEIFISLWK